MNLSFKRAVALVFGMACLFFVGRMVVHMLASDETKIRWACEDALAGFNNTRTKECLKPLADEWTHQPMGVDKELLKAYLIKVFFEAKNPHTSRFLFHATLDRDSMLIEVNESGTGAKLEATVDFYAITGKTKGDEQRELSWRIRGKADLQKDAELGWLMIESTSEQLEGSPLKGM